MRREELLAAQAEARRNPGEDVQVETGEGIRVSFHVDPWTGEEEVVVARDNGPPSQADIDRVVSCLFPDDELALPKDTPLAPDSFELKLPRQGRA